MLVDIGTLVVVAEQHRAVAEACAGGTDALLAVLDRLERHGGELRDPLDRLLDTVGAR